MISPDGKWVVYVSNMSGNADIYLQSTAGQTTINLTKDSTAADDMPAFSPDGDLIAFHSAREGGGLFLMGRTGESVRRLTRFGFQPAWFPDGRRIVFASTNVPFADTRGGTISELWTVDTVGGEPRRLFAGDAVQPKVSPSGQRIAFWSMPTRSDGGGFVEANRDVWTMAVDGSDAVRVTTDLATDWNPVWSPDGHWLYFLSNRAGSMNLWRVPIDEATGVTSGEPEALSAPAPYIRHFSVSADGGLGTYATWSTTNNVARAPFDPVAGAPSGPVQSLTTGPRDFQFLGVSRDGQQLVVGNNSRLQEDLFVLPAAGGVLRNLTNDPARDRNPQWSHDGRQIVFNSDRGSDYEVWSVDRDGGGLRAVTQSNGRRFYPVPSRDGSSIAATDIYTWQAFIYDARHPSKPPIELPPFPTELRTGGYTFAISDWSPNGREVIGHTGGANSRLWVFSLDSQNYRVVAGDPPLSAARWLSDGHRVLAQRNGILLLIDTVSGHARDVLAIPGENLSAPVPTVDDRFLYFLRGTASGDIWLVRFDPRRSGG